MKRLLCIVGSMNTGGAETFLMKMYRGLDKSKYQMDFAVALDGLYDNEIRLLGGRIYHVVPKSRGPIKNFISIGRIVKENSYDYVLRVSQNSLSAMELLAAKLGGAKICSYRSSNSNTVSRSKKELILHKACMWMPRLFADVRFAPSTGAAEFMFGQDCIEKKRAYLLNNGLDLDNYKFDAECRINVRKEFGIEEKLVIGHIGRFVEQKNHRFLLEVFCEIKKQRPDSVLLLIGEGPLENAVRRQADQLGLVDSVVFTGVRSDISRLLSAMDVFVFPSLYEGMPNTVIEAQATGLPCVISDSITREANITGLVQYLQLGDAFHWAETALSAITPERPDTHKAFIEHGYDIETTVKRFVDLVF